MPIVVDAPVSAGQVFESNFTEPDRTTILYAFERMRTPSPIFGISVADFPGPSTSSTSQVISSSILQKRRSQDDRTEIAEITSDMVQPSFKQVRGERKCWKCFSTDCIGAKNKNSCTNACASCNRKDCHGKNSRHPTRPCEYLGRDNGN